MAETIVFGGPTLASRRNGATVSAGPDWRHLLDGVDLRPPARRGDVLAALAEHPRTVVLIDGYYYTVPAVTHKELLYAIDAGVRVIGGASLGALRAAELAPCGMIGIGQVYDWYRSEVIDGDDEVAVLHGTEEHGYRPLTIALVDLRYVLENLVERLVVERSTAERLVAAQKELPFSERFPARLREQANGLLTPAALAQLEEGLATGGIKVDDARRALALARQPAGPSRPRFRRQTTHLSCDCEGLLRTSPGKAADAPSLRQACWMAQLLHPAAGAWIRRLQMRYLLSSAAPPDDLLPSTETVDELAEQLHDHLRQRCGWPVLPEPEIVAEARCQALANAAQARWGTAGAAARAAARCGLSDAEECLELFVRQQDLFPAWWIVRALTLTSAFPAAVDAAAAALAIHRVFREAHGNAIILRDELAAVAAAVWACGPDEVVPAGGRRALHASDRYAPGLWQALEWIAPAERVRRDLADYRARRTALVSARLEYPLPLPAPAPPAPPAEEAATQTLPIRLVPPTATDIAFDHRP